MSEAHLIDVLNIASALVSVGLVVAIAFRQLDRVMRHRLMGRESPDLLVRDLIFFWALVILTVLPAVAGAFGHTLGLYLWWVILRDAIGIVVLVVWAYYEFVVIGRRSE